MVKWTSIEEIWDPQEDSFVGGFENIFRPKVHPAYESIVKWSLDEILDPRYTKASSSRMTISEGNKPDVFGYPDSENAHCIPHSHVCAPTWGVAAQAVVGRDIEKVYRDDRDLRIKALHQLVLGKVKEDRAQSGLRYSQFNLANLHANHKSHFDERPVLLVVPILPLAKVINWKVGESYPALCITGCWDAKDGNSWATRIFGSRPDDDEISEEDKCAEEEIEEARIVLEAYVKGLADSLTGCGGERLFPTDLFYEEAISEKKKNDKEAMEKKEELELSKAHLLRRNLVYLPKKRQAFPEPGYLHVRKVTIKDTDPALLALKSGVNWSWRCTQKLLACCCKDEEMEEEDPDDAILRQKGIEDYEEVMQKCLRPSSPSQLAAGLAGTSTRKSHVVTS